MRHGFILGLLICLGGALPAPLLISPAEASTAEAPAASALAVYEEGKKLYDAGDFFGARAKFSEAIRREPGNARWHYNLGLALRQLDNDHGAREALLRARELDPDYKRSEIDQKLASMGFDPADPAAPRSGPPSGRHQQETAGNGDTEEPGWEAFAGGLFGAALIVASGIYLYRRRRPGGTATAPPPLDLKAEEVRLDSIAADLTQVEHALARGEHPDLRSRLEYATRLESAARRQWTLARAGDTSARRKLSGSVGEAVSAAGQAIDLARRLHGEEAFTPSGDRTGCFFCARPLAHPDTYHRLSLKRGDIQADVLACPDCAALAGQGQAPTVRTGADGRTHWSELPDYDPYANRHGAKAGWQDIPAWRFQPQRPLGDIAREAGGNALAAAGLLAGAGAAMAATALLDLDAAREAGLSHEALQASARRATEQRSQSSFADHS